MSLPRTTALRLYYVHPAMVGPLPAWDAVFDHAAAMGFDAVLSAPVFLPGANGNILLTADWERAHPVLGDMPADEAVGRLAEAARGRGLALHLDVALDRVSAGGPLADRFGGQRLSAPDALDPRVPVAERGAARMNFDDGAGGWADTLAERLLRLARAGVAGIRALGLGGVPPDRLAALIDRVRSQAPEFALLAWTPGLPHPRQRALEGTGVDAVFSSLGWWDCRAPWIVDEHEVQRRVGRSIAFPEAPFERRLASGVEGEDDRGRALGRALWLSAALGDGLLIPMGFEYGLEEPLHPTRGSPERHADARAHARVDLTAEIAAANAYLQGRADGFAGSELRLLTGPSAPLTALLRVDASDLRRAGRGRLVLVNPDLRRGADVSADGFLPETGGRFGRFRDIAGTLEIGSASTVHLPPGGVRVLEASAARPILGFPGDITVETAVRQPRFAIEAVTPTIDNGRFPVKRIVGGSVTVECDVVGDGHDKLAAALLWRAADEEVWHEVRMTPLPNDRWRAELPLERLGRHQFTVEAWRDAFATFRSELTKKHAAGLKVSLELEEGRRLVDATLADAEEAVAARLRPLAGRLREADDAVRLDVLLDPRTAELMAEADRKPHRVRCDPPFAIDAERTGAGFASWYELFPRSTSGDPDRHGTFDDVIAQLPRIRDMGFDVLYFPPIHPIGRTNRKGRNNSLKAGPGDPGSPYAIGSEDGGHDAVHPELGTLDDFRRLVAAAADHGLELALDFAIQCSPDHPWLKEHPEWFDWRPDGSIRYAENPPKKYEDIVNVDFYAEGAIPSLWLALRDVVEFWVNEGVRLFRVDNPHTKAFPFWEWMIADVRSRHPDVAFLAEAFTRPKIMYRLAKLGFSQSYTYFTWRNAKWELEAYLNELAQTAPKDFFRPHFFVNTPDINPVFLQGGERSAHLIRAALATTLSGLWGMYNGFEILEARPVPGKEEYLDSEKYEIRAWDWDRPGNIVAEITRLNRIRRDNPALHSHLGVTFLTARNDNVLFYRKATPGAENVLLIGVTLDPRQPQEADVELPLWDFGRGDHGALDLTDLVTGAKLTLRGKHQRVRLDPHQLPFFIWRVDAARD